MKKAQLSYYDKYEPTDRIEEIRGNSEIELFENYYKLNNGLRYCNGSYYDWTDIKQKQKYREWLKSDDFKKKHFSLYYGNGVVD